MLPLQTFALISLSDVDYALYLLNFDNIELGVSADGSWSAYYRQSCRFLDPDTFGCRLHGTPDKPHVCVQYNPFSCFYRKAFGDGGADAAYLRIDRQRMQIVADSLVYDTARNIVGAPTIESLAEAFSDLPLDDAVVPAEDPPMPGWVGAAADPTAPCDSCAAHCCTTLMFPIGAPAHVSSLDYLRFALGFPGTEVVVVDDQWQLAVRSQCRHLDGGRCGAFGSDERPLRCSFYDAWTCSYRPVFDGTGAASTARLRLEDFPVLAEACSFNPDGTAAVVPVAEDLRPAVAAHRAAASLSADRPPVASTAMIRRLLPLTVVGRPAAARGA